MYAYLVQTIRSVKEGQEITLDYGSTFWTGQQGLSTSTVVTKPIAPPSERKREKPAHRATRKLRASRDVSPPEDEDSNASA